MFYFGVESSSSQTAYNKRPVWQWVLVYLVIGGFVYGAIYYSIYTKNETNYLVPSPTESTATSAETLITLTKDGFVPKTVTIKADTKVVWKNDSGITATVDSGDHSNHTAYPPLNLGLFSYGETHSFVFATPGTYNYHNHNNSDDWGTVVVE